MDDLIALDVMKEAKESLDENLSDKDAVFCCLRILLNGFLTEMIDEIEDSLPDVLDARDRH